MNEKKSRALLFILGITFGILIGAGAVYLATSQATHTGEVSENRIEQIVKKVLSLMRMEKEAQDTSAQQVVTDKIAPNKNPKPVKATLTPDSGIADSAQKENNNITLKDSLSTDSIAQSALANVEDIIIKKDELLLSKSIEFVNIDNGNSKFTSQEDSLLQVVSGIRELPKSLDNRTSFPIELWRSPINYRGYKFAKNKLVLFGLDEHAPLKLFHLEDMVYLKYADAIYKIDDYPDFRAFEKVTNPQVITQLNSK